MCELYVSVDADKDTKIVNIVLITHESEFELDKILQVFRGFNIFGVIFFKRGRDEID